MLFLRIWQLEHCFPKSDSDHNVFCLFLVVFLFCYIAVGCLFPFHGEDPMFTSRAKSCSKAKMQTTQPSLQHCPTWATTIAFQFMRWLPIQSWLSAKNILFTLPLLVYAKSSPLLLLHFRGGGGWGVSIFMWGTLPIFHLIPILSKAWDEKQLCLSCCLMYLLHRKIGYRWQVLDQVRVTSKLVFSHR